MLEDQKCSFFLATTLREPVERLESLAHLNQISPKEFTSWVSSELEGQVYYLLFNTCEPPQRIGVVPKWCDPPGHTKNTNSIITSEEIDEVVSYVQEFDFVGRIKDLDSFIFRFMLQTGWKMRGSLELMPVIKSNDTGKLLFTDEMKQHISRHSTADLLMWQRVFGEKSSFI